VPHTSITYFAELVNAFEEVAADSNVAVMQVLSRQDPEREYQRVKSLLSYRVGGLILVPSMTPERTYQMVQKSGVPMVVVDRVPEGEFPFDRVAFDNRAAMRSAGAGLIHRGHRKLLFVVHQRLLNVTLQRVAGLADAAATCAEPVETTVMECADEHSLTAKLAVELRRPDPPTAIIVSNSRLANWLYRALRGLNVESPRDVSIIAFDENEWADIVVPSLSVVRQRTRDIAVMAWRFLLNRISGVAPEPQTIQLQAEVIFRDSVGNR
jgi:LacI family transcriptional regulator